MRVCVMTSVYALSETDRHAAFLVESIDHLVRQGHQVEVFAPSYEGCPSHTVRGVPVHRFRYFPRRWENLTHGQGAPNRIRNPLYLVVAFFYILFGALAAIRFFRNNRFDLVHVNWPFPHGIWGYLVWKLYRIPMVLTFHGAELLLCRKFPFVKPFIRHAAKHARELICNSSYTASELARYTDKSIEIIPFGCTVTPRLSEKNLDKPIKDILFVGRLIARKGVDVLLRALPEIHEQLPVRLHIVGDGNLKEEWMELAEQLGLGPAVRFHGFVSNAELERLYAEADVFVLPAIVDDRGDTEGLGVVLVEALSFGTPVVASRVGGIPDVIIDQCTGLLVPPGNEQALAGAVVRLCRDRALATQVTRRGLAHAQDYFDWGRITRLTEAVYQRALTPTQGLAAC